MRWLPLLLLIGCGGGSGPIDASPGDLATSFCVGTPLDGTCAQSFLAPLYACLQPNGACTAASSSKACWPSGGEVSESTTISGGTTTQTLTAQRDGLACFITSQTGATSPYVVSAGGQSLSYFVQAGKVLCPNNTQIQIGSDYGGCDAFRLLLTGPDFSTCAAGSCP